MWDSWHDAGTAEHPRRRLRPLGGKHGRPAGKITVARRGTDSTLALT